MTPKQELISRVGLGLVFGVALGAVFGSLFGNINLGIALVQRLVLYLLQQ